MDAIEPIRKPFRGRPRKRLKKLHAYPRLLRLPSMPRGFEEEGHNPSDSPAGHRVQREAGAIQVGCGTNSLSWVNRNRRLKVRYERRDDIHQAFLDLGCALICWRYVQRLC